MASLLALIAGIIMLAVIAWAIIELHIEASLCLEEGEDLGPEAIFYGSVALASVIAYLAIGNLLLS